MRTDKLMPMLLQLFDGEGGAADGTGSAPATQNNTADNTAPATQDGAHESTAEDLDKEFKALIKDKYKNAYQKHINAAMQKRFRADEAAQAQYDRVLPLLDMLGEKYGADATDPEALMQALEDDNSFYEQESVEKGVPIESLKQMHKLERENAAFRQEMQERERQDAAAQQYQQWLDESEAVKSLYGDAFDLDAELADPEFVSLLKCPGITLKTAFEARHLTELTGGAMQFAAQSTAKAAADTIRSRGHVPKENASSTAPAVKTSVNIAALTREQHQLINKKIATGELKTPEDIKRFLSDK